MRFNESHAARLRKTLRAVIFIIIAYSASQGLYDTYVVNGFYPDDHLIFFQNYAVNHGIVFGRDTVNTYGPLGFLLHPLKYADNFPKAMIFRLTVWMVTLLSVFFLAMAGRKERTYPLVIFATVIFVLFDYTFIFGPESKNWERIVYNNNITLFMIVITCATLLTQRRRQNICFGLMSFSAAILLAAKFQYGAMTVAGLIYCLMVSMLGDRRQAAANALWTLLGLALAVPIYGFLFLDAANVILFLRGSLEIAMGYSESVSLPGPSSEIYLAAMLMLAFAAAMAADGKNKSSLSVYLIGLFFCFMFFKHSFTRQDAHARSFYLCFALLASATLLVAKSKPTTIILSIATAASIIFLFMATRIICLDKNNCPAVISDRLVQKIKFSYTKGIFDVDRMLKQEGVSETSRKVLCPEIVDQIGTRKTSLWTLELLYINSANINFTPFYVYQEYNDYTPYLDNVTAGKLSDVLTMPEYIIFDFQPIDDRNPFLDSPETMNAITRMYDLTETCGMYLLQRAKQEKPKPRFIALNRIIAHPEERVIVPASKDEVFMSMELSYTVLGKLKTMVQHLSPIYLDMTDENNARYAVRISPKPVASPVLINRLPRTREQFASYMRNEDFPRIVEFKLTGPGLKQFASAIPLTFYKME